MAELASSAMDDIQDSTSCFSDGPPVSPSPSSDAMPPPLSPSPSSRSLEFSAEDWDKVSISSAQSEAGSDSGMSGAHDIEDGFVYLESKGGLKAVDNVLADEIMQDDNDDDSDDVLESGQTTPTLYSDTTSRAASPDLVFEDEEPPPRPSSPYLTEEEVKLDLGFLSKADYDPFTIPRPSPLQELMGKLEVHGVPTTVLRKQPDGDFIRNNYQLGRAKGLAYLDEDLQTQLFNMLETVRWMYGDETLDIEAVHWLLKYAPLPLQGLVRGFAYTIELREGVLSASAALSDYLQSRSPPSPQHSAAIVILNWLKVPRTPDRPTLLFTRPDGSPRFDPNGREPWAWFFDGAARGYPCDAGVLDTWEQTRLAEEDWDIACA